MTHGTASSFPHVSVCRFKGPHFTLNPKGFYVMDKMPPWATPCSHIRGYVCTATSPYLCMQYVCVYATPYFPHPASPHHVADSGCPRKRCTLLGKGAHRDTTKTSTVGSDIFDCLPCSCLGVLCWVQGAGVQTVTGNMLAGPLCLIFQLVKNPVLGSGHLRVQMLKTPPKLHVFSDRARRGIIFTNQALRSGHRLYTVANTCTFYSMSCDRG